MEMKTSRGGAMMTCVRVGTRPRALMASVHRRPMGPDPVEPPECLSSLVSLGRAEVFTVGRGLTEDTGETGAVGDADG